MREMFQKGIEAANKWISVDDELPEILDFGVSENVILKLLVFEEKHKNSYECCIEAFYDGAMDVWRFIIPIDDRNIKLKYIAWRPIK